MVGVSVRFAAFVACALAAAASGAALTASCGGDDTSAAPTPDAGATGTGGQGGGGGGPTNGVISRSSHSQFETDPQVSAAKTDHVAVVWMGGHSDGHSNVGYVFSQDKGVTWEEPGAIDGGDDDLFAPDVASDAAGNFYLVYLASSRSTALTKIMIAKGGVTATSFDEPTEVTDPMEAAIHGPARITVTKAGTLLVTYTQMVGEFASLAIATSKDGKEWTRTVLPANGHVTSPYPCAETPGGAVGRTYITGVYDGRAFVQWSDDDGATWPNGAGREVSGGEGQVAQRPSCIVDGNELWVAYGLTSDAPKPGKYQKLTAVRVAHSVNDGQDIAERYDVHDGEAAKYFGTFQLEHELTGSLDVVYYSGAGNGDAVGTFRRARWKAEEPTDAGPPDTDGGPVGKPSTVIREPITFGASRDSDKWLGDSVGMFWWLDGTLYVAYVDNGGGESHIAFFSDKE